MRVLYLSPWFPYPLDTGSRTRVYYLLRALAKSHQVTIASLDPQGWAPAQIEGVASLCEQAVVVPHDPFQRSRLHMATRFFSLRPVVATPFPEMLRLVNELHVIRPFEVVIAATTIMAPYALSLSGVTRILEEHNSGARWMHERYLAQRTPVQRLRCWVSWRKTIAYEGRLLRRFDLITMVSEQDRAATLSVLGREKAPVAVVPNGVDCQDRRPGLATPLPDRLVYNGSLTYYANYDAVRYFLREIFPRIRQARPQAHLVVTGSLTGVKTDDLPLDDGVTLTGFVPDVRMAVAQAAVCVVPLLDGGGTRLKVLEAMALGTPVVSTSKGAEGLDVTDGEHLLLADDPETFARRTVELLSDADLRQCLAANARRLVEQRYDWDAIGRRFVALVEEAEAGRGGLWSGLS